MCYVAFSPVLAPAPLSPASPSLFFFLATAPPGIYTLSLHDALPISGRGLCPRDVDRVRSAGLLRHPARHRRRPKQCRSEEHTSELQSLTNLVCRLLLEKKKKAMTMSQTFKLDILSRLTTTLQKRWKT